MVIFEWFWRMLKHPVTAIIFAIGLTIVGYELTNHEKSPVYSVKKPTLLAQSQPETDMLEIYWNGEIVPNVYSTEVAIWNEGSDYIDFDSVIISNPLRVIADSKVDVLNVKVINTSRPELNLQGSIFKEKNLSESVSLTIAGDEVLEYQDGGTFHILYSSESPVNWSVGGRIKGLPDGFTREEQYPQELDPNAKKVAILLASMAGIMILALIIVQVFRLKKQIKPRWGFFIVSMVYGVATISFALFQIYSYKLYPEWLIR